MDRSLRLSTPANFNFRTAVSGHGWYDLRPFAFDEANATLSYVIGDAVRPAFAIEIRETDGVLNIATGGPPDSDASLLETVSHILRFDDDLAEFYFLTSEQKRLSWVAELSAGRLLRSATVWEDLVKTICTTNCSWSLTKIMIGNLVDKLGAATADGRRAFPTAEAMASRDEAFYRDEVRSGYRAPYFVELATLVTEGEIDPESWLASELPTPELKKEMKRVKGVGDYAAENLLKLVGRYDGLALDSWLRSQFYKKHNGGEVCDDRAIADFYEAFGRWRGLAIWCDMTENWH